MSQELIIETLLEDGAELPSYGSELAAGADLRAHLSEPVTLSPGERKLIPTGLKVAIPAGYEMQVRPRSGLALKSGITVLNTPGTIDADYRGGVGVILINLSDQSFDITPGMRIAQAVIAPVIQAKYVSSKELSATARGSGGFGSTGTG